MCTKITKRIGFDSMSIIGKLISGASVKFKIGRNGETLETGLSNDDKTARDQFAALKKWLCHRPNENNQERFDRLEKLLQASNNSAELMNNLEKF